MGEGPYRHNVVICLHPAVRFAAVRSGWLTCPAVWFAAVRFGSNCLCGSVRFGLLLVGGALRFGSVRFGSVRFVFDWFGLRFGSVRFARSPLCSPVRFGLVSLGLAVCVRFSSVRDVTDIYIYIYIYMMPARGPHTGFL